MVIKEIEERLHTLVHVFLEENSKINLSAFRTEEDCWIGNVLDSLAFLEMVPGLKLQSSCSFLDLGTGGGFPLIPLALALPEHRFTGIDATRKKIDAVARVCERLKMRNVTLVCGRSEVLGNDPVHREKYDYVLARALASLPVLLEYASPFVRRGGKILAWKSMRAEEELRSSLLARAEFSCHLEGSHRYDLGGKFGERQILIFGKSSPLSKKYPREIGVAKKHPLL